MIKIFDVVCAWCKTKIREEVVVVDKKNPETHGMCEECAEKMRANLASLSGNF